MKEVLILLIAIMLFFHLLYVEIAHGHTKPPPTIDYSLLRDIICTWETRSLSERQKNDYVGLSGELGRCAIRVGTAQWAGYRGSNVNLITFVFIKFLSEFSILSF